MVPLPIIMALNYLVLLAAGPASAPLAPAPIAHSAPSAPVVKIDTAMQQERIALPDGSVQESTVFDK